MGIHNTTQLQPLYVFLDEERQALLPSDGQDYQAICRIAKVHQDHHVAYQDALYSVPPALCPAGQQVEVGLDV